MSDKFARCTRIFLGLLTILVLLPPFGAASEILVPRGGYFRLAVIGALYLGEGWFVILIHELGHALAAWVTRRRVHMICVFPIAYLFKARKFTLLPKQNMGDVGGFVLAMPEPSDDGRRGEALYVLGGVLANLATSAVTFATISTRLLGRNFDPFVGTFALLSLVVAIVNLLPIWGPGLARTDGAHLIDLIRGRRNPPRDRLVRLIAMQIDGVPPAKWNPDLIAQIEMDAKTDLPFDVVFNLLYRHYLARGDVVRARMMLARIASPPGAPAWTRIAEAFFIAYIDKNGPDAQKILSEIQPAQRDFAYWRALAVTRDLLGDRDGALAAVKTVRQIAARDRLPLDNDDLTLWSTIERKTEMPPPKKGD